MLYVEHPFNPETPLQGRQMSLGEKVLETDRYGSSDGTWKAPGQSVGITIQSTKVVWVRPAMITSPKPKQIAYKATVTAK